MNTINTIDTVDTVDNAEKIATARYVVRNLKCLGLWQWGRNVLASGEGQQPSSLLLFLQYSYRYLVHWPLSFTYTILMFIEILNSRSIEQASDIVYIGLTETALSAKILAIWHFDMAAWQLLNEFATNTDYNLKLRAERELWQREQRFFKRFTLYYVIFSLGVVAAASIGVLFSAEYELPFAFWVPFEWRNPQKYWYPYVYSCLAMPLTCFANTSLDSINCYFMLHLSLLYRLLGMRLEALQHLEEQEALKELHRLFILDQNIRRLTRQCQKIVSVPILMQIILSALVLCFSGYRLKNMKVSENIGQFMAMSQYVTSMILQIFLPCYYANEITVAAHALTTHVYCCDWLRFSPSTRNLIFIYMESLKRPVQIKSGNFFDVGLSVFSKTMNNAYSILAVLMNMDKNK